MSVFSLLLALFAASLLVYDFARHFRRQRRLFYLELFALTAAGALAFFPDVTTKLANAVGIGRGVDVITYPLLVWLVREAVIGRARNYAEESKLTELVRQLALRDAKHL